MQNKPNFTPSVEAKRRSAAGGQNKPNLNQRTIKIMKNKPNLIPNASTKHVNAVNFTPNFYTKTTNFYSEFTKKYAIFFTFPNFWTQTYLSPVISKAYINSYQRIPFNLHERQATKKMQNKPNYNTNVDGWQRLFEGQAMDNPHQQANHESRFMQNKPNFSYETNIEHNRNLT